MPPQRTAGAAGGNPPARLSWVAPAPGAERRGGDVEGREKKGGGGARTRAAAETLHANGRKGEERRRNEGREGEGER